MRSPMPAARFFLQRALGLLRRGLASLRTRGLHGTWERVRFQFRRAPEAIGAPLYLPAAAAFAPFDVPASPQPRASIVIPVYNHAAHTLACLRAIAAHPPHTPFEIVVVDDGSSDETIDWLPRIGGVRYHRRAANGGFIAACNDGAALARGDLLVFLNNDTVPQPGWLDALCATFDAHPQAGLVGAQLIYPDGRLQEAGGVVFADGGAWNYGRFESPEDPRYASVRDADYCSGAALAIPRALFASIGGFDARYAPAYYEDTDLAFAVRERGLRVLYQPAARVVHDEGTTSGTDTQSGIKAYQVRNRGIFAERWRDALRAHAPAAQLPSAANQPRGRRQVLIVDASMPRPDRDSASLRLVNLMRLLIEEGLHVVFLPADLRLDAASAGPMRQLGVEVWHRPFAASLPRWFGAHGGRFGTIMMCRHYVAAEILPLARRHAPLARLVFDTIDLHYLRESRTADVAGDDLLQHAASRTRLREQGIIRACDVTLVVSTAERELLARDMPQQRVEVLSNLHDTHDGGLPFGQRRDLVFVGGFRHPPNVDAVRWFVQSIFPRIARTLPGVRFHCIGAEPPAEIRALAATEGVIVHGYVADIAPYMTGCRVAVAPLRFGAGVKGKVNLSMAYGQPVVATSCAVEGMHLQHDLDVLVADAADAFADAVIALYRDEARWQRLAANGVENVRLHFSLDAAREVVRRVFVDARRQDVM